MYPGRPFLVFNVHYFYHCFYAAFSSYFFPLCLHSIFIYLLHFSSSFIFPLTRPHTSPLCISLIFSMVFVHQANCFECIFILIHDKLSGPERHLIGSIFHLQDSFVTLFYISSYRIYQMSSFSTCHH